MVQKTRFPGAAEICVMLALEAGWRIHSRNKVGSGLPQMTILKYDRDAVHLRFLGSKIYLLPGSFYALKYAILEWDLADPEQFEDFKEFLE